MELDVTNQFNLLITAARNVSQDIGDTVTKRRLRTLGIATIRIWEHEIKRASLGVRLVQKALGRRIQDRTTAALPA